MQIIQIENDKPLVSTETIALGTSNQHKSVIQLVRTHLGDLEGFGEVIFQTRLNPQGSPTEYALLNEQQSTLIIAYMRNSDIVRDFKIRLVREFYNLANQLRQQTKPSLSNKQSTPRQVMSALKLVGDIVKKHPGIDKTLVDTQMLVSFTKHTGIDTSEFIKSLPRPNPINVGYMNQTQVGEKFGISNREVGKILTALKLRTKEGDKQRLTELGSKYGDLTPCSNGYNGYQILWRDSIIPLIDNYLNTV